MTALTGYKSGSDYLGTDWFGQHSANLRRVAVSRKVVRTVVGNMVDNMVSDRSNCKLEQVGDKPDIVQAQYC